MDAAKQLVAQLQAAQAASADAEGMCEDLRYTFERLVGALAAFCFVLDQRAGTGWRNMKDGTLS